jgi:hypothetical protein
LALNITHSTIELCGRHKMKTTIWITIASLILIATIVGVIFYFESLPNQSHPDPLKVENLKALANGEISFNVRLNNLESDKMEGVVVNGKRYLWAYGSNENSTIHKDETKEWRIDVGTIEEGDEIQVGIESTAGSTSLNVTVGAPTPNGKTPSDINYVYDIHGGIDLFSEGVHVLATSQDPRTLFGECEDVNDYWKMLQTYETTHATDQDFISILLSRGIKPTGSYDIQIENFVWLESYPVKLLFQVNFTDPGEGVIVTESFTNPLVLVPIGKLTSGEYDIEVPITQYVLNIDEKGNLYHTQILTFAPIFWEKTLIISSDSRNFQEFNFDQWFSDPEIYNGQEISIKGYYFSGFEIIVLSEKLSYSGQVEGHLIPSGRMLWIEGGISKEIYDNLNQQEMMGPTERYGKISIKGTFEYGGQYGQLGQYNYQIIPSEVFNSQTQNVYLFLFIYVNFSSFLLFFAFSLTYLPSRVKRANTRTHKIIN